MPSLSSCIRRGIFVSLAFLKVGMGSPLEAQSLSSVVGGLTASPTRPAPRSAFWNPALMGSSKVYQLDTNIALMGGWLIYDRSGIDPNTSQPYKSSSLSAMAPNPYFSVSTPLGFKSLSFGYSTYFPSGIVADFDDRGAQRYELIEGLSLPWHHQATVVYRPNSQWSIGLSGIYSLGFQKARLSLDLNRLMKKVLDNELIPAEHPSLEARARIPLSTTHAFGGALGVHYTPHFQWGFGLAVFSPVQYIYDSVLSIETPRSLRTMGASLRALGIEESMDLAIKAKVWIPPILTFGILYQPYGYWTMETFFRYAFSSWQPSLSIQVTESPVEQARSYGRSGESLDDHYVVGSIQTFQLWDSIKMGLNAHYASSAVPSDRASVSLIDFESVLLGAFVHWQWFQRLTLGIEYSHSFLFDRVVQDSTLGASPNDIFPAVSSDGNYRAGSDRLAIMVNYVF